MPWYIAPKTMFPEAITKWAAEKAAAMMRD
jgi:hypothetical protein